MALDFSLLYMKALVLLIVVQDGSSRFFFMLYKITLDFFHRAQDVSRFFLLLYTRQIWINCIVLD